MNELSGRVAFVTGAGRGIGRAIALRLAAAGAKVAVTDLHPARFEGERYYRLRKRFSGDDEAVSTTDAIIAAGGQAREYQLDVADVEAVHRVVKKATEQLGPVDILINNAGIVNNISTIEEMDPAAWAHEIQVNLSGAFHCTQSLAPGMAERGWGRIVNIASVAARQPALGQPSYTASKAGVTAFTQSVAQEFGPHGVTANAIMPGLIGTPLVLSMPEQIRTASIKRVPVKRLGTPDDIANLALFLTSEESSFITATAIPCDGGMLGAPLGGFS